MHGDLLDDFEDLSAWTPIASGQARLHISPERKRRGGAMRLDFDFRGGGGFVVARKLFPLDLPESFAVSFGIRGTGPANIFEFKLVDASNQNVWRHREEAFELPADWQTLRIKSSRIAFAWGPLGGGPPRDIAAVELVIAAGPGGAGTVWIDDLELADTTYRLTPSIEAGSALPGCGPENVWDPSPATCWRSATAAGPEHLLIDFREAREYGGLVIRWDPERRPEALTVRLCADGQDWQTCFSAERGVAAETCVYLPDAVSRLVRLDLRGAADGRGVGIVGVDVMPHDFSRSINDFFSAVAGRARPGLYPKYLLGRQTHWTPVGTGEDVTQALMNEEGLVEVDKGAFSVEPFLFADGRLIAWADAALTQGLEQDCLPIPWSDWQAGDLGLRTTAFATGPLGQSTLFIRWRVTNRSARTRPVTLFAAVRPFQVTPTWQHWQAFGGVSPISELAWDAGSFRVDGARRVIPLTPPDGVGAAAFAQGAISEFLETGVLPPDRAVSDPFGYASAALRFDLDLAPGAVRDICMAVPFGVSEPAAGPPPAFDPEAAFAQAVAAWEARLGRVAISLPPRAADIAGTLKTAAAHILISRDGPALQPGPRRYSRAWIRDGALMGAALARAGIPEAGRDFIRWYAGYQAADGNLPDCVDRDGREWLPELDAWGELIFAVRDSFRFTGDRAFLAELWPAVLKSVAYLERLRARRLTPEYDTPQQRACRGLLPESMSHEGYMAHPVHAYWDDFWALRGFKDAAELAAILGEAAEARRIADLRDAFQADLYASLDLVIRERGLDFVPGSVEFADFDPAATAIALTVADELHNLPRPAIDRTFERYLDGFRARVRGDTPWANYSAYEARIVGALVRLGRRREALELLDFLLADRRIPPWNQWPEISWRDPAGPSFIGDMPHSWIGGEYILAVASLFAYAREADGSLVIAAGVAEDWLAMGEEVRVEGLPTPFGALDYRLHRATEDSLDLTLSGALDAPPGGIVCLPPLPRPLRAVEIDGQRRTAETPDGIVLRTCPARVRLWF